MLANQPALARLPVVILIFQVARLLLLEPTVEPRCIQEAYQEVQA